MLSGGLVQRSNSDDATAPLRQGNEVGWYVVFKVSLGLKATDHRFSAGSKASANFATCGAAVAIR